jgi:voltage-gated potassium channel
MAQAALSPAVADFIELTTMTESLDLNFEQVRILPESRLDGVRLEESGIPAERDPMIVAITDQDGSMTFNPAKDQILQAGDLLIAIGTKMGIAKLTGIAGHPPGTKRKAPRKE